MPMHIKKRKSFRKDYRRIKSGSRHRNDVDRLLLKVSDYLVADQPLPQHFRDHALIGDRKGYRECRLKHDFLLIYRYLDDGETIEFVALGSHAQLFGL